jgi:phosphoribosyl 1,2-cyclic phosphodiesterase
MSIAGGMQICFWGVRGSMPSPSAGTLGYGGNTACVEIRLPGHPSVILDAGTGIVPLGRAWKATETHVFLTHFHWDHIAGIPHFSPLYQPDQRIIFRAPASSKPLKAIIEGVMSAPYYPVQLDFAAAQKEFLEVHAAPIQVGPATIYPFPVNHPQGAFGYRIEAFDSTVVYAPDREHGHAELDMVFEEYSQNADVLIHDAHYTPEEYEQHRGWGHSTWFEATRVATKANIGRLILFHHDVSRTDLQVDHLVQMARGKFERTDGAREGRVLDAWREIP